MYTQNTRDKRAHVLAEYTSYTCLKLPNRQHLQRWLHGRWHNEVLMFALRNDGASKAHHNACPPNNVRLKCYEIRQVPFLQLLKFK